MSPDWMNPDAKALMRADDGAYGIPASPEPEPKPLTDKQRLDWLEQRVDGTGETLTMGGVCSWGVEVQRGRYGKSHRLGEGEDLREAIDDAIARASGSSDRE